MHTTEVTYYDGSPAINVRLHASGYDFWPPSWFAQPQQEIGQTTLADLVDAAYNIVQQEFWDTMAERAEATPLGPIHQDGRSGGWLVIDRDPTHGGENDAAPIWLAAYRGLASGVDAFLRAAPERVREVAQQLAMDELGRSSAERLFATHRRELTLREYRATDAASFYANV